VTEFDNRWDNWSGDFAESFAASLLDPSVRGHVPTILAHFGRAAKRADRGFPDEARPGALANVLAEVVPRLPLPDAARADAPEVVARFFEYLRETGRLGEGDEWAEQVRDAARSLADRQRPGRGPKGVTIRKADGAPSAGRNDPCPCGSGKKFKKCCMGQD
jgi:hypothetical protein